MSHVRLTCEAMVAGRRLEVSAVADAQVYEDPEARRHIETSLRLKLMDEIVKQHPPEVKVYRP